MSRMFWECEQYPGFSLLGVNTLCMSVQHLLSGNCCLFKYCQPIGNSFCKWCQSPSHCGRSQNESCNGHVVLLTVKPSRDALSPASIFAVTCLFSISQKWVNLMTGRCCRLCPCFLCCPFPPPPFPPPPHCSLHYIICCSQQVYSSPNVSQLWWHSWLCLFPAYLAVRQITASAGTLT